MGYGTLKQPLQLSKSLTEQLICFGTRALQIAYLEPDPACFSVALDLPSVSQYPI